MALKPINLTSFSSAALLLGTLAPVAFAQNDTAIAPTINEPSSAAPVPSKASSPVLPANNRPMIELSFQDVEVASLLDIISRQFDVQIVVASDVSGIKLSSINLSNKTPEAAIKLVVTAAGLKYSKQEDGTFLIAKTLPAQETPVPQAGITSPFPQNGISPNFGSGTFGGALPPLGQGENFESRPGSDFDVPALIGASSADAKKRQHPIRIRNISSKLMAYWLDPANNPVPVEMRLSDSNQSNYNNRTHITPMGNSSTGLGLQDANSGFGGAYTPRDVFTNPYTQRSNAEVRSNAQFGGGGFGGGGGGFGGGGGGGRGGGGRGGGGRGGGGAGGRGGANNQVFDLPTGVDRVVAIDPQNALLVFGTDEGVRELQDTIQFLDRPLRQVEIEAQFVSVNTNDSRAFGIDYSSAQGNFNANATGFAPAPPAGNGSFQLGFVRGNFQATLSALISNNRAKVITAPRVTAINNLTASLVSSTQSAVVLTSVAQGIGGGQLQAQTPVLISTSIGLTVTPTINNDDTITVLMEPVLSTQTPVPGQTFPRIDTNQLSTIANVRDGETIALGGLKQKTVSRSQDRIPILSNIPILGGLFRSNGNLTQETDLIIFLTARIQRRAGDEDAVPGT